VSRDLRDAEILGPTPRGFRSARGTPQSATVVSGKRIDLDQPMPDLPDNDNVMSVQ
jgi:hypothetical protein